MSAAPVVHRRALPAHALTSGYERAGAYTDCYVADIAHAVTHAQFVEAFYTTWLFRLERLVLRALLGMRSTDAEAAELARARREKFAAWSVEARAENQLLMCDFQGKTRSWLMVETIPDGATRLYFGSVVVPEVHADTGAKRLTAGFRLLLGFHQVYSRALLRAARTRLRRSPAAPSA